MNLAVIQQLLAPVVMISASGLLCLALFNRLSTLVARIRQFNRERLEHAIQIRGAGDTVRRTLELHDAALEQQIPRMLRRARMLHRALLCLVAGVVAMLLCSLMIGAALLVPAVLPAAIGCFVLGVISMLVGMLFALRELTISLGDVELEAHALEELPSTSEPDDRAA